MTYSKTSESHGLSHDSAYLMALGAGLYRSYTVTGLLLEFGGAYLQRKGLTRRCRSCGGL